MAIPIASTDASTSQIPVLVIRLMNEIGLPQMLPEPVENLPCAVIREP